MSVLKPKKRGVPYIDEDGVPHTSIDPRRDRRAVRECCNACKKRYWTFDEGRIGLCARCAWEIGSRSGVRYSRYKKRFTVTRKWVESQGVHLPDDAPSRRTITSEPVAGTIEDGLAFLRRK